jgi:hypothetical protein
MLGAEPDFGEDSGNENENEYEEESKAFNNRGDSRARH